LVGDPASWIDMPEQISPRDLSKLAFRNGVDAAMSSKPANRAAQRERACVSRLRHMPSTRPTARAAASAALRERT
jgi:hypothetical protein